MPLLEKSHAFEGSERPEVSIVMPCYNSVANLDRSLCSLANQSFKNFEILAVDDGSTDQTHAALIKWKKRLPTLHVIKLENNIGPGGARNRAIEQAQCDLIALIDSDDVWHADKLARQIDLHRACACAVSCTGFEYRAKTILPNKLDYYSLLKNNVINTSSIMFDRSKINIRFQSLYKSEDYLAWLDVARNHTIYSVKEALVKRCDIEGVSSNKLQMARQRWNIYREVEHLSWFHSVYYFVHYAISGLLKHL